MKKILILIFSFLLVGCSANYNLTISDNDFQEKVIITPSQEDDADMILNGDWFVPIDYNKYETISSSDSDTVDNTLEHYNLLRNDSSLELNYSHQSIINKKITSFLKCFDSAKAIYQDGRLIITTSTGVICFDEYLTLNDMSINIVVNDYNVIYDNADNVVNNVYIWNINRSNYNNKSINLGIDMSVNPSSSSNSIASSNSMDNDNIVDDIMSSLYIDKTWLIFSAIFLIVGLVGLLIYIKINKDNNRD